MPTLEDTYRQAALLLQTGSVAEAERLCGAILAAAPKHAATMHLLGRARMSRGDAHGASQHIAQAIALNGRVGAFHASMGLVQRALGDSARAEDCFKRALALEPKSAEAAMAYARFLLEAGRANEALRYFRRAVDGDPRSVEGRNGLALALSARGEHQEALAHAQAALALEPSSADTFLNIGLISNRLGDIDGALSAYQRAIELRPGFVDAYNNLGSLCYDRHWYEDALTYCREALRLKPDFVSAHVNLGLTLRMMGRFKEAKASLECALALNPAAVDAHVGLGMIAEMENDLEGSLAHYRRALDVKPGYPNAHYNEAISLLRRGQLADGWPGLEARWQTTFFAARQRPFTQPLWQGEDLGSRTLLVWAEQGVGDEVLYASMIPDLIERNMRLVVECDQRLCALFARSWPQVAVVPRTDPPDLRADAAEIQVPMASLCRWLRPSMQDFPARPSFLTPDPARKAAFAARLRGQGNGREMVVGISWISKNAAVGEKKSTTLDAWAAILAQKGVRFVDLQYGDTVAARAELKRKTGMELIHFDDVDNKKELDDLAALIAAFDLVITVSNTTAHLAGAVGTPTWVLVPAGMGQTWYWFSDSESSPWYASLRLMRQQRAEEWQPLIKAAAQSLRALAHERAR